MSVFVDDLKKVVFKNTEGFFDFPFFTVLDNSQNINFSDNSIINKLLVKGKEYGFSFAFLTENIETIKSLNSVEDRIYFTPNDNSLDYIVKLLDSIDDGKSWKEDLLNLDDDECIISNYSKSSDGNLYLKPDLLKLSKLD